MPPTHNLTILSVPRLDIGHALGLDRAIPIGAVALAARRHGQAVRFTLDSLILKPADPSRLLLDWIDHHLAADVTIAGYRLADAAMLLGALPDADCSPAIRAISGEGSQPVMDLSARDDTGSCVRFEQACTSSRILCATPDPGTRFAAWCRSDTAGIVHDAEVDAIATWRLITSRIAAHRPHGREVAAAMNGHFAAWLTTTPNAAAQRHVEDLAAPAD